MGRTGGDKGPALPVGVLFASPNFRLPSASLRRCFESPVAESMLKFFHHWRDQAHQVTSDMPAPAKRAPSSKVRLTAPWGVASVLMIRISPLRVASPPGGSSWCRCYLGNAIQLFSYAEWVLVSHLSFSIIHWLSCVFLGRSVFPFSEKSRTCAETS